MRGDRKWNSIAECAGKTKHRNYRAAEESISRQNNIRKRGGEKVAGKVLPYRCSKCNFWHIGKHNDYKRRSNPPRF